MATTFLEPGGDADFAAATTNGFWNNASAGGVATDFVHGNHQRSINYRANHPDTSTTATTAFTSAGGRLSAYFYIQTLPGATAGILSTQLNIPAVKLTSGGVMQLWNGTTAQLGSNGPTLSAGIWYRVSMAFTLTSTTVNEIRVFLDGVLAISVTNGTLGGNGVTAGRFGNFDGNSTMSLRSSDHYCDNSSALTDPGNIWVTAKRPVSNGTTNGFTTQIGSGGSGYGTGHSPQVNERPLSVTDGWSMIGAGSAVTEEYNIEAPSVGDIDISLFSVVDYLGWASMSSLVGETVTVIVNGVTSSQAITSTQTLYKKIAGSSTYPAGTGSDIGITTDTSLTTVSLYECGIIVAFIPTLIVLDTSAVSDTPALEEISNIIVPPNIQGVRIVGP